MTYALVKIPETLRSSTGLAALASLGIHGLLWAVLPVLPFESKSLESQSQPTVGLIELTPEEQSRLPSTSEVTLPPFATQQSVLPPLPPPPFPMSALPPLPALPPSFQLPPNPSIPQNSLTASSPSTKTVRVQQPTPTKIAINKPAGLGGNRTYYSDELLSAPRRWTPPPISGLPTNRVAAQPFDPNNFPPPPPIVPVPTPIVPENPAPPQNTNPPQQKVATANQPTPTPTGPPQKVPERTKRELLALRDQLARANRATLATPAPENTPAGMTRQQIVQALRQSQPNQASVSVATADTIRRLEKFNAQQQRVQSEYPKAETKAPIRQKIATCEKQVDGGVAYVKAVVNPQGKIISGPELFDNKGTVDIAQAKAIVRSYPFQADNSTTNYNFTIEFNYDSKCPEPTPEQSPDPQT